MPITKQKKEEVVKDLHERFEKAKISIFVNFHGISVSDVSELRGDLYKDGIDYKVAKKTLINRTLDGFGYSGDKPEFDGELAVVLGYDDVVTPAKTLSEFAKKHKDSLKILGGVYEGGYIDGGVVGMLATIPSREILLGQFVNVINSPVQGFVGTLNGVLRSFVGVLSEINKSRS